jgi:nitrite reductase (NADH) large subunit
MHSNFIIIGNGIAGLSAAETIRANDKTSRILIVSLEKYLTYFRIKLCELIGKEIKNIYMHSEKWYKEKNIELKLNCTVRQILDKKNIIVLDNGEEISYDKLIIATGSSSNIPPIKGVDLRNVFSIRCIDDIKNINNVVKHARTAAVIGGGLLGLEAAYNLNKANIHTTLIERNDRILHRQLDQNGSFIYEQRIKDLGIDVIKNEIVSEIEGTNKVHSIITKSNKILQTDLIVIAAGINPNTNFLQGCNIDYEKYITVNEYMETSVDNIYAAGDVASFQGKNLSLWTVSLEQGKIAGHNSSVKKNQHKEYMQKLPPYFLNSMNTKLYSLGDINDTDDTITFEDPSEFIYHKLFFKNNIIVGAILIGKTKNALKINTGIKNKLSKNEIENLDKEKYRI